MFDFSLNNTDSLTVYTVSSTDGIKLEGINASGFSVPLLLPGQQGVTCTDNDTREVSVDAHAH